MRMLALFAIMTLAVGCATGKESAAAGIDRLMHRYAGPGPGASLLVLRDGRPVIRRSYGFADLESNTAATPATNYRLASLTKQFSAAAILLLVQDGRLALDAPVRQFLPSLPAALESATIQHLLTHSSGAVDYEDVMRNDIHVQLRDADVLALLEAQDRTYFAPGSEYRYSNSGYALLALIVERASGQSFQAFLRDRIFLPLGMHGTVAHVHGETAVHKRAYGYTGVDGRWQLSDQSLTSAVLGDGGIYSSIDDLARWDAALYDDRLLTQASRLAFTAHVATDDPRVAYGFGWRISGQSLWHSGESIGFRNVLVRYPERRLTVIILSNRNDDPGPYETADAIARIFLRD